MDPEAEVDTFCVEKIFRVYSAVFCTFNYSGHLQQINGLRLVSNYCVKGLRQLRMPHTS